MIIKLSNLQEITIYLKFQKNKFKIISLLYYYLFLVLLIKI